MAFGLLLGPGAVESRYFFLFFCFRDFLIFWGFRLFFGQGVGRGLSGLGSGAGFGVLSSFMMCLAAVCCDFRVLVLWPSCFFGSSGARGRAGGARGFDF